MTSDKRTLEELRIDRTNIPRRNPWPLLALILGVLGLAGGALYWWTHRPVAVEVRTALVQESGGGGGGALLNASGYVTARRQATVSSKVTGKVVEVKLEEGMRVESGQILAKLDSSNVDTSLKLAEARLESARKSLDETRAGLQQAEREYSRISRLAEARVTSASELDRAEAEARTLRARLARQTADVTVAEKEVAVWNQELQDRIIRAPFAGIVISKNAQPGEMISPVSAGGGFTRTGIGTIVDMESLEIEVDVNENYINRVQPRQPVEATLDSYPDVHFPSHVIAIIPAADRQKATVKVRVGFDKLDPRILPDMGVKVAFQSAGRNPAAERSLILPKAALRSDAGRTVVWIVREERLERRAVSIGKERGEEVQVTSGVSSGDRVVVEGPAALAEGMKVKEKKT